MLTSSDLVGKLVDIAENHKTLYVMGCFGAPLTASAKTRYTNNHEYNKRPQQRDMIMAASEDTFGFDCVCLIKGVLWGWVGDRSHIYGGARYASNGVPDIGADGMINVCRSVSSGNWTGMVPGEALWVPGHIGVYIGGGLAVECTAKWAHRVQITAVGNIGPRAGYNTRTWQKHGRLPYVDYAGAEAAPLPDPEPAPRPNKSTDELVQEIINGEWGNGDERRERLTAAGYDYNTVQAAVNEHLRENKPASHTTEFIDKIGPMASSDMEATGILASLTIAQAILESGWGKSSLTVEANNLFGIKGTYKGRGYTCPTREWVGDHYETVNSTFRRYPSWAESIADHSALFLDLPRYANLRGCRDYRLACKYVKEDGYATDPQYTQLLIQLIEMYNLTAWDCPAPENTAPDPLPAPDPEPAPRPNKSTDELVQEIINGEWGNGDERRERLTAAGYDYNTVQSAVNDYLASQKAPAGGRVYTVQPGDCLWVIAHEQLGRGGRWREIYDLNNLTTDVIKPGQQLILPD